jgi:VanZ family protein
VGLSAQLFFWAFLFVILIVPWMMARAASGRAPPLTEDPSPAAASRSAFTSDRERRLWLYTLAVLLAIYSTLSPAQELAAALRERGLLVVSSGAVMLLVGLVIAVHWAKTRPGRLEVGAGLGVAAIYLTTMVRMPVPEARSHLFEYGLVAMLIYQALTERQRNGRRVPMPPLLAFVATAGLGWFDEGIQALLPNRVYDLVDVGLNAAFALMAITSSLFMSWARRWDILSRIRRDSH